MNTGMMMNIRRARAGMTWRRVMYPVMKIYRKKPISYGNIY